MVSGEVPRNSIDYLKANVDSLLNPDFFKYDKDKKVLISEPYTLGQGTYVFVVKQDNKKLCSIFLTDKGNGDFDWPTTTGRRIRFTVYHFSIKSAVCTSPGSA